MIKKFTKETIGFILVQISRLVFRKPKLLSIYFHNPSKKVFESILTWLTVNKYHFISADELNALIQERVAPSKKTVSVTFDDGWNNNMELIDLIEKFKVPVTIFIPTEAVTEGNYWFEYASIKGQVQHTGIKTKENFKKLPGEVFIEKVKLLKSNYSLNRSCVSLEQLQLLSQNKFITIGSHSVTHPVLKRLSPGQQEQELMESKKTLGNWLNTAIDYFSYPNGDYDEHTISIAKKGGYKLCFSTGTEMLDITKVNQFAIPRHAINDHGGYYENVSKALGMWQKFRL